MSDGSGPNADDWPAPVTCPCCNQPVVTLTIVGPTDGVAGPCGCRVAPDTVTDPPPD